MTKETLRWLHWLVSRQTVDVAAPEAPEMLAAARQALAELAMEIEAT
jgi:hypothetical protein